MTNRQSKEQDGGGKTVSGIFDLFWDVFRADVTCEFNSQCDVSMYAHSVVYFMCTLISKSLLECA